MKTRLSQAGYMRSIFIGGFIVLLTLIGSIIWLSYNMFTPPAPKPAALPVAVRAKIPPMPGPKKIEQPSKVATPLPQPEQKTPETPPDAQVQPQPEAVDAAPAATNVAPEQNVAQTSLPVPVPAGTSKAPEQETDNKPEMTAVQTDQNQPAQPAAPGTTAEQTVQPPVATASAAPAPAPAEPTPPAVAEAPVEKEAPAPKPVEAKPEPAPAPAATRAEAKKTAPFSIQVGAYHNKTYAEASQKDLEQKGYDSFIFQVVDKNQRAWYMVRIGHFETRQAAAAFLSDFTAKENISAVIAVSGKR